MNTENMKRKYDKLELPDSEFSVPFSESSGPFARSSTPMSGYSSDEEYGPSASQPLIYNDAVSIQLHQPRSDMKTGDVSQVLIIYTGGTIGMKNTRKHGYVPVTDYLTDTLEDMSRFHDRTYDLNFRRFSSNSGDQTDEEAYPTIKITLKDPNKNDYVEITQRSLISPPSLVGKRIRYTIIEYEPLLDSCNMTSDDWVRIATDIESNYESFDAFIILHGTDTMSYTASALSFLLEDLGKTVILTGSQVPLSEVRNDAVENLLGALTIAGHYVIPEVCLFFNNKLFRGNRCVKMNAVDFDAFDSPNLAPLATVGINIKVNWAEVVRPSSIAKFKAHKSLNRNVSTLRLFPGITEDTVKALLAEPIEGVILETYGAGNAPSTRDDIMRALASASDRGVVIVNCTQCIRGIVTDLYATGKALRKVGVVSGNDMTPECALVKLAYLLSDNRFTPAAVRELMTRNLRGELTVVAPKPRFTFHNRTHKIIQNMINAAADANQAAIKDTSLMMDVQEKILMEKSLYPILLCSAAGTDDLDGMLLLSENYEGMMLMLNCVDYDGRTPLHIACTGGHHRIVKFLLQNGASVHMRDKFGHTPLYEAARNKHKHIIHILRETGAHFNDAEINDVMFQALSAAANGDVELLKHFVDAGIDINRTGFDHRTALHHAVAEGCLDTVQYLLSLPDINTETKDRWGKRPIDDAEMNLGRMWGRDNETEKQLREIVRLLRDKADYEEYGTIKIKNQTPSNENSKSIDDNSHLSGVNGVIFVVNGDSANGVDSRHNSSGRN